ncbi:hypothetical protein GJR88_00706 [Dietzia sp. DQ12-45-1b]|nr:hypothetical protein GJR88_00706 [Dietzia sp. DQ12-45-1b]
MEYRRWRASALVHMENWAAKGCRGEMSSVVAKADGLARRRQSG